MTNPFKDAHEGTLIFQDPESNEFNIWFPYTRDLVRKVRKGSFVGVKNFDSRDGNERYSLLEIMEAKPEHYALGGSMSSIESTYPGFVQEAAKSARLDWEQEEPTEHTTIIRCKAAASGRELRFENPNTPDIGPDDALPMIGEDVHLLSNEMMTRVINEGLIDSERETIVPGSLKLDEDIPYHLDIEELLKTHFGAFGFTGAGKSNLLSTMVAEILENGENQTVVFSDLMGEYTSLLVDLVNEYDYAFVVATDPQSVPGGDSTFDYLEGDGGIEDAVESITRTLLLPRELESYRSEYPEIIREILEDGKVQILSVEGMTVGDLLEEFDERMTTGSTARRSARLRMQEILPEDESEELTEDHVQEILDDLRRVVEHEAVPRDPNDWGAQGRIMGEDVPPGFTSERTQDVSGPEEADFRGFNRYLMDLIRSLGADQEEAMTRDEILNVMDSDSPALIILQSDYSDDLKVETSQLMSRKFDFRRRTGTNTPQVTFILDEADEFIPGKAEQGSATARVKATIETIARRGRKFGVGVGIATQRATYLDTNIMAQPHTYLVSKLPRKADRDRIGEAFGLQSEVLERTLDFQTGEWLSVSFEAAGIDGFPIPVRFENANERIKNYLESR